MSRYTLNRKIVGYDIGISNIPNSMASTDAINVINGINQGDREWNRIGNKVRIKTIRVRGRIWREQQYPANAPTVAGDLVRLLIVYDAKPLALPQRQFILGLYNRLGNLTSTMHDPVRPDRRERFKIVHNKYYVLNQTNIVGQASGTATNRFYCPVDLYIRLGDGLDTSYNGIDGTLAQIENGAIYIFAIRQENTGTTNWQLRTQVSFEDM